MRKLVMAALVALIGVLPLATAPAGTQTQTAEPCAVPAAVKANGSIYPILVGLGAVAGVAVYNMATFGVAGVPFLAPAATTGAMVTAGAISQNRLYTVISAVTGAWVANWLYGN
jgi:hypothetical protein